MRIILLGAPGAGKGTQCKRITAKYGLAHLSSGDILRQQRAADTEFGRKAQSFMDSGGLVPDDIMVEVMAGAIREASSAGFVLDGFPRTVNQARELDRTLAGNGEEIDVVLNLVIEDQVVLRRMSGRRSCPKCGAVYHTANLKPRLDGVCDNDGAELVQRPDDNPDVVANRLKTYHLETERVVDYYRAHNTVYDIDASGDVDATAVLVFEKLDTLIRA